MPKWPSSSGFQWRFVRTNRKSNSSNSFVFWSGRSLRWRQRDPVVWIRKWCLGPKNTVLGDVSKLSVPSYRLDFRASKVPPPFLRQEDGSRDEMEKLFQADAGNVSITTHGTNQGQSRMTFSSANDLMVNETIWSSIFSWRHANLEMLWLLPSLMFLEASRAFGQIKPGCCWDVPIWFESVGTFQIFGVFLKNGARSPQEKKSDKEHQNLCQCLLCLNLYRYGGCAAYDTSHLKIYWSPICQAMDSDSDREITWDELLGTCHEFVSQQQRIGQQQKAMRSLLINYIPSLFQQQKS